MPDNVCDGISLHPGNVSLTSPLRVITQYSGPDVRKMQSPNRPTSLGVCVSGTKSTPNYKNTECASGQHDQMWQNKIVDNTDFEKLLGQLGTSGSTPVTPTSFLNPRNITEDQEIFADNFSRTLNKLQAEHEGWPCVTRSDDTASSHSFISQSETSGYLKTFPSPSISSNVSTSRLAPVVVLVNVNSEQNRVPLGLLDRVPSRPTDLSRSPKLTANPLVSVSALSGINSLAQSSILDQSACTEQPASVSASLSTRLQPTWSGSIQRPRNVMELSDRSCLPTILTIATSLKEACVEQAGKSDPEHYSSGDFSSATNEAGDLSPFLQGAGTFLSGIPQLLDTDRPTTIVRYTLSNSIAPSTLSNGSCTENILASLVCVSSSESVPRRVLDPVQAAQGFDIRGSLNDFYTVIRPDTQSTTDLAVDLNNKISTNFSSAPVALVVAGSSVGSRVSHSPIQGTITHLRSPLGSTTQPPSLSPFSTAENMNSVQLLGSNSQHLPLTALYSDLNSGSFSLATSRANDLLTEPSTFMLQPNVSVSGTSLSYIPNLTQPSLSSSGHDTDTIANVYSLNTLHSGSILHNGSDLNSPFMASTPAVAENCLLQTGQPARLSVSQCSRSSAASVNLAHSAPFPSSVSINPRRNKRAAPRKISTNQALSSSAPTNKDASIACADSSTDVKVYNALLVETGALRTGLKRQHDSSLSFVSSEMNATSTEAYVDRNSSVLYLPHSVAIKQEPVQVDLLDSASNHSDPYSTETGINLQSTTPCSLDGIDLKLERKRARNRVAARRCRERKLSLIRALENQVAERDVIVKNLEDTVARYRSDIERLRAHVELLSNSYPSLKAELCQFSFLFHGNPSDNDLSKAARPPVSTHTQLSEFVNNNKHFSQTH